jgi:hypothetical protein
MKLRDISAVSTLSSELKRAREQEKALTSSSYKKGAMVTLWSKNDLTQQSFNVDLDGPFVEAMQEALKRRIEAIEREIKSYGVEL